MQSAVYRVLEFDRVRQALSRDAATALGRMRALALEPASAPNEVDRRLTLTAEAVRFTQGGGSLGISAPEDLAAILGALDVEGQPLEPLGLVGLARFLDSVGAIVRGIYRGPGAEGPGPTSATARRGPATASADGRATTAEGQGPRAQGPESGSFEGPGPRAQGPLTLADIAARAASFEEETERVRRAIDPSGDVNDDASPALREIREKLRRQRAKLRATLESLTHGRDTAKYLQDQIVTDRNGRYVVMVRAEHREAVPGIVHGSSTSGASLYLEPLATVDLNNDIVGLVEREKAEVFRILLALSDAFRARADELAATLDVAADLDELYAKTGLARRVDGIAPALASDGRIEFRGARHPLLIPAVRDVLDEGPAEAGPDEYRRADREPGASPSVVTPSDLLVVPPARALVISGPNTGGKTVALKAFGLLALMAQSGLLIPAEPGSAFTPLRSVFADIGDEQSIAASLSTFSAHVANIVDMERALDLPALVLLDEVGGGTDPVEGGALGIAVIDHFRRRGALVVATTHDDALKSYASTTEGVIVGAFGFNPDTYAPTYRLVYGAPGRSLALEIAARLGLPADVIAAARARRSTRETQLAEHLARVDRELASLEAARGATDAERAALENERRALVAREARLTEREAVLKRRMDDRLNERLREARAEIDAVVADLKTKAGALAHQAEQRSGPRLTTGEIGSARAEARAALASLGERLAPTGDAAQADQRFETPPTPGQSVFVPSFGVEAIVRGVSGAQVDVEVRGKRMRVGLADLRRASQSGPRPQASGPRLGGPTPHASSPRPASTELVLIGQTVDQALDRAAKFLDDAILTDERRLRVVHGHGTGRLREALRSFLREHPLVESVSPAPDNEGGQGATIVELRE